MMHLLGTLLLAIPVVGFILLLILYAFIRLCGGVWYLIFGATMGLSPEEYRVYQRQSRLSPEYRAFCRALAARRDAQSEDPIDQGPPSLRRRAN